MSVSLANCIGNKIVAMFPLEVKVSFWYIILNKTMHYHV